MIIVMITELSIVREKVKFLAVEHGTTSKHHNVTAFLKELILLPIERQIM